MYLFNLVFDDLRKTAGGPCVSPHVEFKVTLWKIFTPDPLSMICGYYDIREKEGKQVFARVISALHSHVHKFVNWPTGDRANTVMQGFERLCGWKRCLGAMGYTTIHVKLPHDHGYGLVEIQLVCDDKGLITTWECGFLETRRGSYGYSELATILDDDNMCPGAEFIIGPSAVGHKGRVLTPYNGKKIRTRQHLDVNYTLSRATRQVKKCIAIFKSRMRSLLHVIPIESKELLKQFIGVCVMIHNICLESKDSPRLRAQPYYVYKYGRYFYYDNIHHKRQTDPFRSPNDVKPDAILKLRGIKI